MKFKKLILLIVVMVLLAAASLFKKGSDDQKRKAEPGLTTGEVSLGQGFSESFVSKVEISRGTDEKQHFVLAKQESGLWKIENVYGMNARKEAVESFLASVKDLRGEVRSEEEALLGDFAIGEDQAFRIRVYGKENNSLSDVLVSPKRPRGTQNFVRASGSPQVVATDSDVLAELGIFSEIDTLRVSNFSDLRVAGLDSSSVASFELTQSGGKTWSFTKTEAPAADQAADWSLGGEPGASVDPAQINQFLASIYNLYANEAVDPAQHADDFKTGPWFRARMSAGHKPDTYEIWLGPHTPDKKVIVRSMPDGLVYHLHEDQIGPLLTKTKESFLKTKGG